jgi:hypothetical protein
LREGFFKFIAHYFDCVNGGGLSGMGARKMLKFTGGKMLNQANRSSKCHNGRYPGIPCQPLGFKKN